MDLRTKLVFALVAVSLLGMAALGTIAYDMADRLLADRTLRQLNSLAEAKEQDLESVLEGWEDRVTLITSRTQLRISLRELQAGDSEAERERIERILADAREGTATVRAVAVYDAEGRPVARAGTGLPGDTAPGPTSRRPPPDSVVFQGITFPTEGESGEEPMVEFLAPLELDGEKVGTLRARLSTRELRDVAGNFTGLGETGETMIALRDSAGRVRILHPVRFPASLPEDATDGAPGDPVTRALAGEEGVYSEGLTDYRGEPVWAATRFLPELGWGLAVKSDAAEERAPIREFRRRLMWGGLSLSAIAILGGILLGVHLAGPIQGLAEVAGRLREGDLEARAEVETRDELGILARAFNEMAKEMEQRMTLLQEYKQFFLVSPDMLCIAGPDGYFKRVNPAFERTLGWPEEELLSRPFVDFVHPDDVEKTIRETEQLARGIPTISFENRYRLPDGSYERLEWTCHPDPETGLFYAVARVAEDGASEEEGSGSG